MEEKVQTRHPRGKSGWRISKRKYDALKDAMVAALRARSDLTFGELAQEVGRRLQGRFDGSIPWYVEVVKLDLEARGQLQRVEGTRPQKLRLVG